MKKKSPIKGFSLRMWNTLTKEMKIIFVENELEQANVIVATLNNLLKEIKNGKA